MVEVTLLVGMRATLGNRFFLTVFLLPRRCIRGYGIPRSMQNDVCLYYITIIQRLVRFLLSFLIGCIGSGLRSYFSFLVLHPSATCFALVSPSQCYPTIELFSGEIITFFVS